MFTQLQYDNFFFWVLGISVTLILGATWWIVAILIHIEASKASFVSVHVEQDHSLQMTEESPEGLEVEKDANAMSSTSGKKRKGRRVRTSYKLIQVLSVSFLLLLTYLILVVSSAPGWASALGSIGVFGVFLRYQIGDELRRQRLDRIVLTVLDLLDAEAREV